mgnify:CR=1 FL=1
MKTKIGLLVAIFFIAITSLNAQEAAKPTKAKADTEASGLPGDNLDLYATLDLFQKSKTIEEFEASLNDEKTGINNLDLDLDSKVDFIKVVTQKEDDDFAFVLQVDVLDNEIQDVAVILVTKNKAKEVTIQMVGDEELYGKDYVIEPKKEVPAITANPAYSGTAVVTSQPASVVYVESAPIVQYVYSPVYVPYYPPYYYGYYPPYYQPYPVISINIYFGRNRHHHNHYHGGHRGGNTVIINNNNNTYNNYSRTKNTSNTVNRNKNEGSYTRNSTSKRASSTTTRKDSNIMNQQSTANARANSNRANSHTGNINQGNMNKGGVNQNKSSLPTNRSNTNRSNTRPALPTNQPKARAAAKPANKPRGNQRGN